MIRVLCLCVVIVACWMSAPLMAADMFTGVVPVKSQSANERSKAAREAFLQVARRVSGFDSAAQSGPVRKAASSATRYVVQFRYMSLKDEALKEKGYKVLLSLQFSEDAMIKVLREAQQPVWTNRPSVLLWLVEDHPEEGRRFITPQSQHPALEGLRRTAQRRGLTLEFPLFDLDDQLALKPEQAWSLDDTAIMEASDRYNAGAVLVGRITETTRGELWSAWQVFHAGSDRSYDDRMPLGEEYPADALGAAGLEPLANFLADRYAIRPSLESSGKLMVQVSGLREFGDYRAALSYLENLRAITRAQVFVARQDTVLLSLDAAADIDRLLKVFSLDRRLRPASGAQFGPVWQQAPQGTLENPLELEWAG